MAQDFKFKIQSSKSKVFQFEQNWWGERPREPQHRHANSRHGSRGRSPHQHRFRLASNS